MSIELDNEVADKIALATMQDHLKMLEDDLNQHRNHGAWMHPEDVDDTENKLIPSLKVLIKYYGG
jgi:hypothetical protein